MRALFYGCSSLTTIPVDNWNTSKVTSMFATFDRCSDLSSLNISKWDTSNVTNFSYMFWEDAKLTTLAVDDWDTSAAENMEYMFESCTNLASLNVSKWNTANVLSTSYMFANCPSLKTLDVSKWNVGKVSDPSGMFRNDTGLTELNVQDWDTSSMQILNYTFAGCSNLTTLDVSKWNTASLTSLYGTFSEDSSLTGLDVSNWKTDKVTTLMYVFLRCTKLTKLDLSKWNTDSLQSLYQAFNGCSNLTELDVSTWNTSKVSNFYAAMSGLSSLTSLDLSSWSTASAETTQYMFSNTPIKKLVLGKDFTSTQNNMGLYSPNKAGEYTGRWSKEDGTDGMSASDLMTLTGKEHDSSGKETGKTLTAEDRAGTWVWERGYTLTVDPNGSSDTKKSYVAAISSSETYGDSASVYLTDPAYTRAGYKENGANSQQDGKGTTYSYPSAITLTADKAIYAQWVFDGYKISYDANGGTGSMDATELAKGDSATLSKNIFTRTGYSFNGWNTEKNGSGTSYKDADSVTPTGDMTLYAQWKGNSYTVKFDSNGASGTMDDESMTYGTSKALSKNKFTKSMYAFDGWNTKMNGSGTNYKDEQEVSNLSADNGSTVTLYAQWKKADWTSQGQEITKTKADGDTDADHDAGTYIVTIPTKIKKTGKTGKVSENISYDVNVTGNIPEGNYVHVNAEADETLSGGEGTIDMAVQQGKKTWSETEAYGSVNPDGSLSGTTTQDQVSLTGTALSLAKFTGLVTYSVEMNKSNQDSSSNKTSFGSFKITSTDKQAVATYEDSGQAGFTAGTTLTSGLTGSKYEWSINGNVIGTNSTYTVTDADLRRGESNGKFQSNKLECTVTQSDGTKKTAYVYLAVPLTYSDTTNVVLKRTLTNNGNVATESNRWQIPAGAVSFKAEDAFMPSSMYLFAYNARTTLTTVDGANIDTSNATTMQDMFWKCSKITQINVSSWDVSKVDNFILAFGQMTSLIALPGIENWNVANATKFQAMFYGSTKLHADLSSWNMDKADEASRNGSFANGDPYVVQPTWQHK